MNNFSIFSTELLVRYKIVMDLCLLFCFNRLYAGSMCWVLFLYSLYLHSSDRLPFFLYFSYLRRLSQLLSHLYFLFPITGHMNISLLHLFLFLGVWHLLIFIFHNTQLSLSCDQYSRFYFCDSCNTDVVISITLEMS